MCGIFSILSFIKNENASRLIEEFKLFEDFLLRRGPNSLQTNFYSLHSCDIFLAASVLWLQGKHITEQPLENENSVFIYNGDVFGGVIPEESRLNTGDTKPLFELLSNTNVYHVMERVEGPYAFVYLNKSENKIYFGRDIYGRRSLLISKSNDEKIIVTSVAKRSSKYDFIELPCIGIFNFDLTTQNLHLFPWKTQNKNFHSKLQELELFLGKKILIENNDSSSEEKYKFKWPDCGEIQLITEIETLRDDNVFNYLIGNPCWLERIKKLNTLLENSLKKRLRTQPKFCQNCFNKWYECDHSIVGILFSGGVDCALLTLLTDKLVDGKYPIDLINVAFESDCQTPDRITGLGTFEELTRLRPQRKWNFVQVDVSKSELDEYRSRHITHLIYPLKSVLDDSLGCALWFASRAKANNYTSPCRVLLVGMGADELFGGYTRHRAALQKSSWEGLHQVLGEDWQNLPHRNLARDDRVVSDHGRQLRTPYLDEEVVEFVRSLNCWEKTLPSRNLAKGIGDKVLLRSLAYYLGLKNAATFTKRALQFGSRIANPKENGHEISPRL